MSTDTELSDQPHEFISIIKNALICNSKTGNEISDVTIRKIIYPEQSQNEIIVDGTYTQDAIRLPIFGSLKLGHSDTVSGFFKARLNKSPELKGLYWKIGPMKGRVSEICF